MQYIIGLLKALATRIKALALNPFRNLGREIQRLFNANMIAAKVIQPITKKSRELFHIKPESEKDYYSVGRFFIAKKLIVAVVVLGCVSVFAYFILIAEPVEKKVTASTGIVTSVEYYYNDIELSEYSGKANILAAGGARVYTGDIKDGVCTGNGILYNQSGVLMYEGEFLNNKLSGYGTEYASDGSIRYEGKFENNLYSGEGTLYYPSGQMEYRGMFRSGFYEGNGVLYQENGNLNYEGSFQSGYPHGSGILYYEDDIKRYEGEFTMGKPQGEGTLYTTAGRPYYTGIVANGDVAYEALVSLNAGEVAEMFYESPAIYYTLDTTCFVYDTAQVILEMDCIVRIISNSLLEEGNTAISNEGDGWYLPEGEEDAVVLDDSKGAGQSTAATASTGNTDDDSDEEEDKLVESLNSLIDKMNQMQEEAEDADKPTDYITQEQKIYYYVNNSEWVAQADLDDKSIRVEGVTAYHAEAADSIAKDQISIPANGVTGLSDCIAIGKIRRQIPTAFSNITFEEVARNYQYTYVKNINYAQAIYEERIEKKGFLYQMCYEIDNAKQIYYYKISGLQ